jgi:hypothetical protein
MQRTKKQHIVPQFYLRNFTDPKGRLWVYDKVTKLPGKRGAGTLLLRHSCQVHSPELA